MCHCCRIDTSVLVKGHQHGNVFLVCFMLKVCLCADVSCYKKQLLHIA